MSKLLISAQVVVWGFEVHLPGLQTSDLRRIATLSLSINLILCLYSRTLIFTVVFDVVLNWFFLGGYIPYPFFKEIEYQRRAWMQPSFASLFFEEKVFAGGLIGGESAFAGQETNFLPKFLPAKEQKHGFSWGSSSCGQKEKVV